MPSYGAHMSEIADEYMREAARLRKENRRLRKVEAAVKTLLKHNMIAEIPQGAFDGAYFVPYQELLKAIE